MHTPTQKLKRALWLAFSASHAVGYGALHINAAAAQTEDSLYESYKGKDNEVYADYAFGRMMKTGIKVDDSGVLSVHPESPRHDYQSWAGTYPSGKALIEATEKSLG